MRTQQTVAKALRKTQFKNLADEVTDVRVDIEDMQDDMAEVQEAMSTSRDADEEDELLLQLEDELLDQELSSLEGVQPAANVQAVPASLISNSNPDSTPVSSTNSNSNSNASSNASSKSKSTSNSDASSSASSRSILNPRPAIPAPEPDPRALAASCLGSFPNGGSYAATRAPRAAIIPEETPQDLDEDSDEGAPLIAPQPA